MSDPVSRSSSSPTLMCIEPDNESATSVGTTSPSAAQSSPVAAVGIASSEADAASDGSRSLVSSATQSRAAQLASQHSSAQNPPSTSTSQERAAAQPMELLHLDAGKTSSGDVYVEAAVLKGTQSGVQAEFGGVSVQLGEQQEFTGTVARVSVPDAGGRTTLEAVTGNSSWGTRPAEEDSQAAQGAYGVTANLVAAETTRALEGGHSVTLGASLGAALKVDFDVQDSDQDGRPEECAKVSIGPATLGACVEPQDLSERVANAVEAARAIWQRM